MQEVFEKIKERVCEFIHERNKSGSAPCKNQRASCLQLIRVCDLTAIVNQVAEECKTDTNVPSNGCASNDLISKTRLMEDIRNTITEMSGTMDWLNLINRQSVVSDNGWIPCSERLPENDNNVNVTIIKEYLGKIETATAYYRSDNGKWYICEKDDYDFLYDLFKVIAWRPLPEPYKEQKESV